MQTKQFSFKKAMAPLLVLTISVFSLWAISSCKGEKDKKDEQSNLGPTCMTLTKAQINNNWVTQYTKPTLPKEQKIAILKFYSSYNPNGGFDVSVQAFNEFNTKLGNLIDLNPGVACGVNLSYVFVSKSIDIEWSSLNIVKPDGTLIDDFTKIILTPAEYSYGGVNLLMYEVTVVTGDVQSSRGSGLPCPPCINCRPPCEPDCVPPCTKEDSMTIWKNPVPVDKNIDTAQKIK